MPDFGGKRRFRSGYPAFVAVMAVPTADITVRHARASRLLNLRMGELKTCRSELPVIMATDDGVSLIAKKIP